MGISEKLSGFRAIRALRLIKLVRLIRASRLLTRWQARIALPNRCGRGPTRRDLADR